MERNLTSLLQWNPAETGGQHFASGGLLVFQTVYAPAFEVVQQETQCAGKLSVFGYQGILAQPLRPCAFVGLNDHVAPITPSTRHQKLEFRGLSPSLFYSAQGDSTSLHRMCELLQQFSNVRLRLQVVRSFLMSLRDFNMLHSTSSDPQLPKHQKLTSLRRALILLLHSLLTPRTFPQSYDGL